MAAFAYSYYYTVTVLLSLVRRRSEEHEDTQVYKETSREMRTTKIDSDNETKMNR